MSKTNRGASNLSEFADIKSELALLKKTFSSIESRLARIDAELADDTTWRSYDSPVKFKFQIEVDELPDLFGTAGGPGFIIERIRPLSEFEGTIEIPLRDLLTFPGVDAHASRFDPGSAEIFICVDDIFDFHGKIAELAVEGGVNAGVILDSTMIELGGLEIEYDGGSRGPNGEKIVVGR